LSQAWNQAHWTRASEEERAGRLKRQADLFDKAVSIALMRFDHEGRTSGAPPEFAHMNGLPLVVLKPVSWLRGKGASAELQLAMNAQPSCGASAAEDAFRGKPGDLFLIYFSGEAMVQADVLDGYGLGRVIEPRALAALMKPGG
jgi:hypothetical protein